MIVPVMAISNLVLTQHIYSEETNGAQVHNRDRVPLRKKREPIAKVNPVGEIWWRRWKQKIVTGLHGLP